MKTSADTVSVKYPQSSLWAGGAGIRSAGFSPCVFLFSAELSEYQQASTALEVHCWATSSFQYWALGTHITTPHGGLLEKLPRNGGSRGYTPFLWYSWYALHFLSYGAVLQNSWTCQSQACYQFCKEWDLVFNVKAAFANLLIGLCMGQISGKQQKESGNELGKKMAWDSQQNRNEPCSRGKKPDALLWVLIISLIMTFKLSCYFSFIGFGFLFPTFNADDVLIALFSGQLQPDLSL